MAPSNALPIHGNEKTMNLNSLVLANIQASPYFKVHLYELKTYHKVIDEIYYKVNHLEPWEKGSRKLAGQTGMCGGVRGVGTGGIVSSAYCLLYKLYTLKLTRKQLIGLCTHSDSSFIRALGLMYIRYTQPPNTFWEWLEPYLDDDEEVDPKAGGGNNMTIGEMCEQLLLKLDWYGTLFPRIPVPIQKDIENRLSYHKEKRNHMAKQARLNHNTGGPRDGVLNVGGASSAAAAREDVSFGEAERQARMADRESTMKSSAKQSPQTGVREASLPSVHKERQTFSKDRSPADRRLSRSRSRHRSKDRKRHRSHSSDEHSHKHKHHKHHHHHHHKHKSSKKKHKSSKDNNEENDRGSREKHADGGKEESAHHKRHHKHRSRKRKHSSSPSPSPHHKRSNLEHRDTGSKERPKENASAVACGDANR